MSIDDIINIIKLVLGGKKSLPEVLQEAPLLIVVPFVMTLLGAAGFFLRQSGGPNVKGAVACFFAAALCASPLLFWRSPPPVGPGSQASPSSPPGSLQPRFSVHRDETSTGKDLVRGASQAEGVCQADCSAHKDCVAYVFDPSARTCQLKLTLGNRSKFAGSILGIKLVPAATPASQPSR